MFHPDRNYHHRWPYGGRPDKPKVNSKDDFIRYKKDGKEVHINKNEVQKMEEVK
nr:DUF903 domain-containing protein [Paenalcaligenes hominis]